jgi:uncharacterized cupin superfamily protein
LVAALAAQLVSASFCSATVFTLERIYTIDDGHLKEVDKGKPLSSYVRRLDEEGRVADLQLGISLLEGDTLKTEKGVNLLLKGSDGSRTWLDWTTTVYVEKSRESRLFVAAGDVLHEAGEKRDPAGTSSIAMASCAIHDTGTLYHISVDPGRHFETVYVFDGEVELRHRAGPVRTLRKGDSVWSTSTTLEPRELYAPDKERIEKWRKELGRVTVPWLIRGVSWFLKSPCFYIAAAGAAGTYIAYEAGKSESSLDVTVHPPDKGR